MRNPPHDRLDRRGRTRSRVAAFGEDDVPIRSILIFIVLVWIAFAILGAILHLFKWLLYIAVLATLAAVVIGLLFNRSGRAGGS
jgi:fatty acid desaturase